MPVTPGGIVLLLAWFVVSAAVLRRFARPRPGGRAGLGAAMLRRVAALVVAVGWGVVLFAIIGAFRV